jgi:hypothetical protein
LALIINNWSCKETIEDILPKDNPYDEPITWSGYLNTSKTNPFSSAFNEVSFKFDNKIDEQIFGVAIENTNLS